LFPLKLLGFWLLAHGSWVSAVMTIIFAKLLGVGVTAFVFDVTRPKLLEMAWFRKVYDVVIDLRRRARAVVEPIKLRITDMFRSGHDGWSSRMLRLIQRFRKRVREAR
jgi:hypothetical protein